MVQNRHTNYLNFIHKGKEQQQKIREYNNKQIASFETNLLRANINSITNILTKEEKQTDTYTSKTKKRKKQN